MESVREDYSCNREAYNAILAAADGGRFIESSSSRTCKHGPFKS